MSQCSNGKRLHLILVRISSKRIESGFGSLVNDIAKTSKPRLLLPERKGQVRNAFQVTHERILSWCW